MRSGVYQINQLVDSLMRFALYRQRVLVEFCVAFEFSQVKNLVRKVRRYQDVDVKVDITEDASIKLWWYIDVAVEVLQLAIGFRKAKYVVPTIQPVVFNASGADRDLAKQIVFDIAIEGGVEYKQRVCPVNDASSPAAMLDAIVLAGANDN
jgi:hypothetical protein